MQQARAVLGGLVLLTLPTSLFEQADTLEPDLLRSRDQSCAPCRGSDLGDDLDGIFTYDDRLASAARALGAVVMARA